MTVTQLPTPVFTLTCDGCEYVAGTDELEGHSYYFGSIEGARTWARDEGWDDNSHWPNPRMLCPACFAAAEDAAVEAEEDASHITDCVVDDWATSPTPAA